MKIKLFTFICIALFTPLSVQAIVGVPVDAPTEGEMKSIELLIQIYQTLLAVSGGALAYFLTQSGAISKLLRSKKCTFLSKVAIFGAIFCLLLSAAIIFWNLFTISHQLRLDFLDQSELVNEDVLTWIFAISMILSVSAIITLWRSKIELD